MSLSSDSKQSFSEPVASSEQIFDAVTQFLFKFSSRSPLLVVLDDMQWCDKTSLDLLRYLSDSGFRNRKMIVMCVCRSTYLETESPSLYKMLTEFSSTEKTDRAIQLDRFDLAHTENLIRSSAAMSKVPDLFCEFLYRKTGGNPLFVRETLALINERFRMSAAHPISWDTSSLQELELPSTVEEVVRQRLAPLEPELNRSTTGRCPYGRRV